STNFLCYKHSTTPPISTLSLHDALPISSRPIGTHRKGRSSHPPHNPGATAVNASWARFAQKVLPNRIADLVALSPPCPLGPCRRSEEHTSELQSRGHLVCRLLLEKKKKK